MFVCVCVFSFCLCASVRLSMSVPVPVPVYVSVSVRIWNESILHWYGKRFDKSLAARLCVCLADELMFVSLSLCLCVSVSLCPCVADELIVTSGSTFGYVAHARTRRVPWLVTLEKQREKKEWHLLEWLTPRCLICPRFSQSFLAISRERIFSERSREFVLIEKKSARGRSDNSWKWLAPRCVFFCLGWPFLKKGVKWC